MTRWKIALSALGAALMVAGCGGGGGSTTTNASGFNQMVVFGDSLSDIGTYNVGTVAALGGGKFTVNSPTAKNWTQLIAAQYGLPTPCAAQTGLPSVLYTGFTGAAVQNFSNCRNYAQGSARVTSTYGPSSLAIQQYVYNLYGGSAGGTAAVTAAANAAGLGLMAVPVVTQMNTHLTNVGGAYTGKELVAVLAGGNDVFLNLAAYGAVATNYASPSTANAGAAGLDAFFAGWSTSPQNTYAISGTAALSAAQTAAVGGMAQAATDLATDIKTLVLAAGAKHVLVVNLPDVSQTPYVVGLDTNNGTTASNGTAALVQTMVKTFNSTLASGLSGVSGVLIVDAYTQNQSQVATPSQYSLTNVTTPACSTTSAANPLQGDSLACTAASTIAGDTSHYLFADNVHPTPYGYQLLAQFVTKNLLAAGWN